MIKINKITRGRFGNRVLQFNSLYQLSKTLNTNFYCDNWEGCILFKDIENLSSAKSERAEELLTWDNYLSMSENDLSSLHNLKDICIDDPAYMLHNVFYKVTNHHPREFLKLKDEWKMNIPNDCENIGIHIRGDDIISRDGNGGREIHPPDYYISAIEEIESQKEKNTRYILCTDDVQFDTSIKVFEYLREKGYSLFLGPATSQPDRINHFADFSALTQCDYLIASSSTYAIAAGLIGNEKKIIHSKTWIDKNINHEPWHKTKDPLHIRAMQLSFDNFWIEVSECNSEFYKPWRIL